MDLAALDRWLDEHNMNGHWQRQHGMGQFQPYLWRWSDIYHGLMVATEVVPMDQTGRRTIQLRNPSLGGRMTNTIHISIQCVMPGEIAKAHRHNAAAIRFVVKASPGAFTVVEGEPSPMEEGDFVTTPSWTWHDHYNSSKEPIVWLDGLDVRLVSIGKMFSENFRQERQPHERPVGYSATVLGDARPSWIESEHPTPPYRYPWADTYATLAALRDTEGDPHDGILLRYLHPVHGGPTLPTFSCEIQLLRPQEKTRPHRHNSTTIYQAFRGEGVTVVENERLQWLQGDIFVVPPWEWHHHENLLDRDVLLFSMTDWPALAALGLYREEKQ